MSFSEFKKLGYSRFCTRNQHFSSRLLEIFLAENNKCENYPHVWRFKTNTNTDICFQLCFQNDFFFLVWNAFTKPTMVNCEWLTWTSKNWLIKILIFFSQFEQFAMTLSKCFDFNFLLWLIPVSLVVSERSWLKSWKSHFWNSGYVRHQPFWHLV